MIAIRSSNIINVHRGIIGIRKLLSINNPLVQTVIDSGIVPQLIELIKQHEFPQLQMEAAWIIANVAAGTTEHCEYIIKKGIIPLCLVLIQCDK